MKPVALRRRLRSLADRLAAAYGVPRRRRPDPLACLVETLLSQNTSDLNSGRAYASLCARFASWPALAAASPTSIEAAIRSGGLARTKSRTLHRLLAAVRERFSGYELRGLRRLSHAEAELRLRGLPGVGPKTRACVLLFACGKPAFPVDTHVHRITRRVGLLGPRVSAEQAHAVLAPSVAEGRHLELHLNLIRLGREVCRARAPRCPACPVLPLCDYGRRAA